MSAQSTVSKLSKADRKLQKKIAKSQRTLLKHEGIETSEKTTKVWITSGGFVQKKPPQKLIYSSPKIPMCTVADSTSYVNSCIHVLGFRTSLDMCIE